MVTDKIDLHTTWLWQYTKKTEIALTIRGLVWSGRVLPPASLHLVGTLVSSLVCTSAISIVF